MFFGGHCGGFFESLVLVFVNRCIEVQRRNQIARNIRGVLLGFAPEGKKVRGLYIGGSVGFERDLTRYERLRQTRFDKDRCTRLHVGQKVETNIDFLVGLERGCEPNFAKVVPLNGPRVVLCAVYPHGSVVVAL